MSINNGGPAFPRHALEIKLPDGSVVPKDPGMTLRDWFASQALQGLLASTKTSDGLTIAKDAYILADAMLRVREVKP
jgi:hypothetical protein